MRWLLHGNLTSTVEAALRRHGQDIRTGTEIGLAADADPDSLFQAARKSQLEIMTADPALALAPFDQRLRFDRTMVLLHVDAGDVEQDDAIDRLFERYKRLSPGRLYTVTASRVKIRQLPTEFR
jgi:hypothetical protein